MNIKYIQLICILMLSSIAVSADIGGKVLQDLPVNKQITNTYGLQDNNELGVQGVTVTAYPGGITTSTDENGSWNLTTNHDSRIEFSNWPDYLEESYGQDSTSVQFISNSNQNINFFLHNPSYYIGDDPKLVTSHFINGRENPDIGSLPTIFSWNLSNRGDINTNQVILTDTDNVRSVWGLTYSSTRKELYAATLLRRHSSVGSNGVGAIYKTNTDTNITTLLKVMPNVGNVQSDVARILHDASQENTDAGTFKQVAKVGLGDIELSEDESTLYVMNLFNNKIYELNPNTGDIEKEYNAPAASCNNGTSRSFSLNHHEGSLYIGSVCDANETTVLECNTTLPGQCPDLTAHVFKIPTGDTIGTEIFTMRLDYDKQRTIATGGGHKKNWNPWTDTYSDIYDDFKLLHPVPIFSSLKFNIHGDLLLGLMDRTSLQGGDLTSDINGQGFEKFTLSGGDILTARLQSDGNYTVIDHNFFDDSTRATNHLEGALGAIANIKGSQQVILTQYDNVEILNAPLHEFVYTRGVTFLSDLNGSRVDGYRVSNKNRPTFFGKNTGLGDIELITEAAPLNIGNRIWFDANENCVQDINESGIDGITVSLVNSSNTTIEINTTINGGNYLFTNVNPNENYIIRITDMNQSALTNKELTTCINNNGEGNSPLLNNSDANLVNNRAEVVVNASSIQHLGANNHSFDIGFKSKTVVQNTYILGNRVWLDNNRDGIQDSNESGYNGVTVELYDNSDCSGTLVSSTTTANDGLYQFTNLNAGDYCLAFNLPTDHNITNSNLGGNEALDSDVNSNGKITNINLTADDLDEDVGIYPKDIVLAVENHNDGTCTCHPYETKSVPALNLLSILLLMILTYSTSFLFRNKI